MSLLLLPKLAALYYAQRDRARAWCVCESGHKMHIRAVVVAPRYSISFHVRETYNIDFHG